MIIIIVHEGKESNTEVNFFQGLAHFLLKISLKIYPFEKSKKSLKREKLIKERIKFIISENFQEIEDHKTKLFFIGDGDRKEHFISMENTKEIIIKYVKSKFKKIKVEDKILMNRNFNFENLYRKMSPKKSFPSKSKKASNKYIFNNFANEVGWFKGDKLNFKKIIKDMKKTNNNHIKIIEAIYLWEKYE